MFHWEKTDFLLLSLIKICVNLKEFRLKQPLILMENMCKLGTTNLYTFSIISTWRDLFHISVVSFLNITKTILIPSSIPLLIFFHEIRCITTWIYAWMSYIFHLIVYKWSVKYHFCTVLFYIYIPFFCFNV